MEKERSKERGAQVVKGNEKCNVTSFLNKPVGAVHRDTASLGPPAKGLVHNTLIRYTQASIATH